MGLITFKKLPKSTSFQKVGLFTFISGMISLNEQASSIQHRGNFPIKNNSMPFKSVQIEC